MQRLPLKQLQDELQAIEEDVNNKIRQNINLKEHVGISLSQAKKEGAIMLFREKYEELVRMVQFNNSKELCGGTHVSNTSELGIFSLQSESSISSGIRRIEACTSNKAYSYLKDQERQVKELVKILKNKDVKVAVEKLILDLKKQEKQLALVKKDVSSNLSKEFLQKAETVSGIRLITEEVSLEANEIKQICFSLRASEKNLVVVLIVKNQEKLLVNISVTDDLIKKGIEADKIIKEIAKVINGGGGGQSTFATAGGAASAENISKVLLLVKELINK